MMQPKGKSPTVSAVESRYLMMPNQANPYGTAFGGVIMAWIDMVAAMAAQKHCGKEVVTAGMDSLSFHESIRVGEIVLLKAMVNYAGTTSMEVGVQVVRDNPETGEQRIATTAHLTFVALDEKKRPSPVPPIVPDTEEEKRRYANAEIRVQMRKQMRKKLGEKE
ncbi:MAG: acyl-CoA thioesterase [Sedimentisphaerales bacterium]|nr:acyl-CoA thioesterase [Sedimentisphaerales bacterium]